MSFVKLEGKILMILPSKVVKPYESLVFNAKFILVVLERGDFGVDELYNEAKKIAPEKMSIDKFVLCMNFLYITGNVDIENEIVKAKFR